MVRDKFNAPAKNQPKKFIFRHAVPGGEHRDIQLQKPGWKSAAFSTATGFTVAPSFAANGELPAVLRAKTAMRDPLIHSGCPGCSILEKQRAPDEEPRYRAWLQ